MKLRTAAYAIRAKLNMPVPLPYFHALNLLQNINYGLYTYALLEFESNLTPVVLWVMVVVTVGMREVATALSNPFGDDDVDFPVNKWIAQLRGMALVLHPANVPCAVPEPGGQERSEGMNGAKQESNAGYVV
uniref:Bestrophin homolog n=1 Tax=Prymnesium polylepis TaxID=72548 RepID=A0A7S4NME3_9EUKA